MCTRNRIVLAIAIVVVPLVLNLTFAPAAGEAASHPDEVYYIDLRFTGLMVFTLVPDQVSGQNHMRVSFHSKADYHNVTITIVDGPRDLQDHKWITYPLFLVRKAKESGSLTLDTPGSGSARWGQYTPFSMKTLHSTAVEEEGELRPALIVKAGEFTAEEPREVKFANKHGEQGPYQCRTAIVVRIELAMNEVARLIGASGTFYEFPKPTHARESFKVQISNLPDFQYIEKHHHFTYYYDGARVVKNGKREKVKKGDQFEVEHEMTSAIETRPCIPITYQ